MATGVHIGPINVGNTGSTGNTTVQGTFTLPSPPPLGGATAVKFGQATTSVQTVGSVQTVTNSVPVLTRDSWYWPGINGESFPPSISNATATSYSNILGRACYKTQSLLSGNNANVTWPLIDRISFDATKTSRVDNFWLYRNIADPNSCKVTGIWGTLDYGSGFTTYHITGPAGGTVFDTTIPIGLNVWENVQLISDPVNGLKFSVGTTAVTLATVLVPTNSSVATQWALVGNTSGTAISYGFDNYSVTFQ